MPYWQLFYHIVTATRDRDRLLTKSVEPVIFKYLKEKCYDLGGDLYALNGVEDHVHLVVAIPPKVAVAVFIGQIKGYASSQINQNHPHEEPFLWQAEYGVFSFDKKRLSNYVAYVEQQKKHHRTGQLITILEKIDESKATGIAEGSGDYDVGMPFDLW